MNESKNVIIQRSQIVQVSGKGKDKATAMADALGRIHKQIINNANDVTVRIEPTAIEVIQARVESYTEHFLFIFFPRKRTTYYVDLRVAVSVKQIEVNQIEFEEKTVPGPDHVALPKIHKLRGES